MKTSLFQELSETGATAWKQPIERDLKGEPYDALVWRNPNGFEIKPFYTGEDQKTPYAPAFTHSSWIMGARPLVNDATTLNKRLLHLLQKGADGIAVQNNGTSIENVLRGIQLDLISSTYCLPVSDLEDLRKYL